jgi:hypothetical protein
MNRLARQAKRGRLVDPDCVFREGAIEDRDPLFFSCPEVKCIWNSIVIFGDMNLILQRLICRRRVSKPL